MPGLPPEPTRPFRVITTEGTLVQGYMNEAEASASVPDRNARAERLGIKARYMVQEVLP